MSERYKILKAKCEWSGDTVYRIVDIHKMEVEEFDYKHRRVPQSPPYNYCAQGYIRIYEEGGGRRGADELRMASDYTQGNGPAYQARK